MTQAGMQAAAAHPLQPGTREPSMEEILASIRRIIEDSDHSRRAAETQDADEAVHAASHGASDTAAHTPLGANDELPELRAFRAGLSDNGDAGPLQVGSFDATPLAPGHPMRPAAVTPMRRVTLDELPKVEAAPQPVAESPARPFEELSHARQPAWAPEIVEPVRLPDPVAAKPAATAAEPAVADAAPRTTLISEVASRQVAAAFGELSDVFAASRRRSFDEVAEEMMRPLLQEWLDNNLPLLVERLVREEIERVARGGQR